MAILAWSQERAGDGRHIAPGKPQLSEAMRTKPSEQHTGRGVIEGHAQRPDTRLTKAPPKDQRSCLPNRGIHTRLRPSTFLEPAG